jgi:hypothetical protein
VNEKVTPGTLTDLIHYLQLSLMKENPMNKIFYFLMVSIAFTGLQVMTAGAAENCANAGSTTEVADCWKRQANSEGGSGDNDDVALTIGDARCIVANEMRDTRCPNYRTTDEGKADTVDDNASAHKVGQERWDPAMKEGKRGGQTLAVTPPIGKEGVECGEE